MPPAPQSPARLARPACPHLQGGDLQAWYCDFSRNTAAVGAGLTVRDPDSSAVLNFCTLWQNGADGEGADGSSAFM